MHPITKLAAVLVVLTLVCSALVSAQDISGIDDLKAEVGFSTWPGKGGALKKGLDFQPSDYASLLSGFTIVSSEVIRDYLAFGAVKQIRLMRGSEALDVMICVAFGSSDKAHELFLRSRLALRQIGFSQSLQRGDLMGIVIGDLNFVPLSATTADVMGVIAFLRNNVFCILADGRPDAPATVALRQLAAAIDAKIQSSSDLTPRQFDAGRPNTQSFSPADAMLQATEEAFTTLTVDIVDPSAPPEPISREFLTDGNLTIEDTGSVVMVFPSDVLGLLEIELFAINTSRQFSTATTSITVVS